MKSKPLLKKVVDGKTIYVDCEPQQATHLELNLPGPYSTIVLPVMIGGTRKGTNNWTWNGDVDKPTLKPSVLTTGGDGMPRCHTWITDGKVQFLNDCTHELAGKTLDLLDIE